MIFEMEFFSEIFRTKGEYFQHLISEKYRNSQPTDFSYIWSHTAKSMCATLQPLYGEWSHISKFSMYTVPFV